jgi:hypothetical protein
MTYDTCMKKLVAISAVWWENDGLENLGRA